MSYLCLGGDIRTQHLNLRRLFASDLSVRILASAMEQQCEIRMSLCRDLLILLHIIAKISARVRLCTVRIIEDPTCPMLGIVKTSLNFPGELAMSHK